MSQAAADGSKAGVRIEAAIVEGTADGTFRPGRGQSEWFQDAPAAPRMVVVPSGRFMMGSPDREPRWRGYDGREEPRHEVTIPRPFAVSATPVTRREFAAFATATNHQAENGAFVLRGRRWWALYLDKDWCVDPALSWRDPGYEQTDDHPVVCVSWNYAQAYCTWLGEISGGKRYRLLSEAEWEYCCRAGTTSAYSTGDAITREQANFGQRRKGTTPVGQYAPNPWGLYDMHGNIWEWVEDVWHPNYQGAPTDGSAWTDGDPYLRGLRGGAWDKGKIHFRSADRGRGPNGLRNVIVGFRVARDL